MMGEVSLSCLYLLLRRLPNEQQDKASRKGPITEYRGEQERQQYRASHLQRDHTRSSLYVYVTDYL